MHTWVMTLFLSIMYLTFHRVYWLRLSGRFTVSEKGWSTVRQGETWVIDCTASDINWRPSQMTDDHWRPSQRSSAPPSQQASTPPGQQGSKLPRQHNSTLTQRNSTRQSHRRPTPPRVKGGPCLLANRGASLVVSVLRTNTGSQVPQPSAQSHPYSCFTGIVSWQKCDPDLTVNQDTPWSHRVCAIVLEVLL